VLMPGEVERRTRAARMSAGIELDDTTWADLKAAAASVGISEADARTLLR
jgi:uncharacterized oxidoreductase